MGAWGHRTFENDDAMDFAADLHEAGNVTTVFNAINNIVEFDDEEGEFEPDAPVGSMALAAIEYVAAAKGNPSEDIPEGFEEWLEKNPVLEIENIVSLSKQAIQKIRTTGELKDLWAEEGDDKDWLAALDDLEKRIS